MYGFERSRGGIRPEVVEPESERVEEEEEEEHRRDEEDESGDIRVIKGPRVPTAPSAEDVRLHRLTHWPFRSWCTECVKARKVDGGHPKRPAEEDSEFPEFHFDYAFFRDKPGAKSLTVIIGKDRRTRTFIAHAVPKKGASRDWIAKRLARDS